MESPMEVSHDAGDSHGIDENHSPSVCEVEVKCMSKRPAQSWENDASKVPKLSCLHLSPNAKSCDPRIFPVAVDKEEINNDSLGNQIQPQSSVRDMKYEVKEVPVVKSGAEMKKLIAQKIAIGM